MTDDPDYGGAVGAALTSLANGLLPYVDRVMADRMPGLDWPDLLRAKDLADGRRFETYSKCDLSLLLRVMTERLGTAGFPFDAALPRQARTYASELREVRNRWAHNQPFTRREAVRATDSAELLLAACGAKDQANQIAAVRDALERPSAAPSKPPAASREERPDAPTVRPEAARPTSTRRDRHNFVHITLGRSKPQSDDPFNRPWIGYDPKKSPEELWEPNRGYWRLDPDRVDRCDLAIFSHQGVVVLVATITGLTPSTATSGKYVGRYALDGAPHPDHPLLGEPQPIPRSTGNPVGYGSLSGD